MNNPENISPGDTQEPTSGATTGGTEVQDALPLDPGQALRDGPGPALADVNLEPASTPAPSGEIGPGQALPPAGGEFEDPLPGGSSRDLAEYNRRERQRTVAGHRAFEINGMALCHPSSCPLVDRNECQYLQEHDGKACQVVEGFRENRLLELREYEWIKPSDSGTIHNVIKQEVVLMLLEAHLYKHGLMGKKDNPDILKLYLTTINGLQLNYDRLGFSPAARLKLGVDAARGENHLLNIEIQKEKLRKEYET